MYTNIHKARNKPCFSHQIILSLTRSSIYETFWCRLSNQYSISLYLHFSIINKYLVLEFANLYKINIAYHFIITLIAVLYWVMYTYCASKNDLGVLQFCKKGIRILLHSIEKCYKKRLLINHELVQILLGIKTVIYPLEM